MLIITIGLVLLVSGEAHFDPAGFSLVMVAACCAGLRFTLTQVFLHGHHDTGKCWMGGWACVGWQEGSGGGPEFMHVFLHGHHDTGKCGLGGCMCEMVWVGWKDRVCGTS